MSLDVTTLDPTFGTYVRWRVGEEPRSSLGHFAPLTPDHPLVGEQCQVCGMRFVEGQRPLFAPTATRVAWVRS